MKKHSDAKPKQLQNYSIKNHAPYPVEITNRDFKLSSSYLRELALAISFVSFGSNQIFFFPHLRTLAASRF